MATILAMIARSGSGNYKMKMNPFASLSTLSLLLLIPSPTTASFVGFPSAMHGISSRSNRGAFCPSSSAGCPQFIKNIGWPWRRHNRSAFTRLASGNDGGGNGAGSEKDFTNNKLAIELLLGMTYAEIEEANTSKIGQIVFIGNKVTEGEVTPKVGAKFETLFRMNDGERPVFGEGRNLMQKRLGESAWLSGIPLEASYAWTLSCGAAKHKKILFCSDLEVDFLCETLKGGHLFSKDQDGILTYDASKVEGGVLYHVDEPTGQHDHPLCDLFFRGEDGTIYLISITGGIAMDAHKKVRSLAEWMPDGGVDSDGQAFVAICLAPFAEPEVDDKETKFVYDIREEDAQELLGGLMQLPEFNGAS